ncbi:MAG: hypothetical protein ArsCj_1800 [Arsenophonus endosymbiont of Ceratovacuna japonica]
MPKLFNPRKLLTRIRMILQCQVNEIPGSPDPNKTIIKFGKFKLNLETR